MTREQRQELFNYLSNTFNATLLESDMNDIEYIVKGKEQRNKHKQMK